MSSRELRNRMWAEAPSIFDEADGCLTLTFAKRTKETP